MWHDWLMVLFFGVAFIVTTLVYPHILDYARRHGILDNPNARKLQRVPVPVMGGTAVFIGFLISLIFSYFFIQEDKLFIILGLLSVMYAIGVWDDSRNLSPELRLLVEILTVWCIMIFLNIKIDHFHGLFGLTTISNIISIPLSIFAGVGIINAINMIDGVDGYCSTYGVMTCGVFAFIFYYSGDATMLTIALINIGALIPFFFHNVFGLKSKMFLGDGGSLMLGTLLTIFVFNTLSSTSPCRWIENRDLSPIALCLSIMAVPIFDTLKVMSYRIKRGKSPFRPDKTHLHHLFIDMDFSHIFTSGIIVFYNLIIVIVLLLSWRLGASVEVQLLIVVFMAMLLTWGFYFFMVSRQRQNDGQGSEFFRKCCSGSRRTQFGQTKGWKAVTRIMDSRFLGGKSEQQSDSTQA